MKRPLNSEELGAVGETRFRDHCETSGLIANPSDRDKTGWDFIVEWPSEVIESETLDKRPIPISCNVQVKTIWVENSNVSVRLSSVERLAKDPRPCFIYILRLDNEKKSRDAFIVHVRKEFSALILKKLRKAEADSVAPNQKFFSFSLDKWAEKIALSDKEFRIYAEKCINVTMAEYSQKKDRELKKLGFENGGLSFTATFTAKSQDEIFNGFLGLTPLQGRFNDAVEERFGIALPSSDMPDVEGRIEIQPEPSDTCKISIRRQENQIPLVFDSEMFTLPSAMYKANMFKAALRTELFDLVLNANLDCEPLDFKIKFGANGNAIGTSKFDAEVWLKFYEFMAAMDEGELSLELQPSKVSTPITGKIRTNITEDNARHAKHLARLSKIALETLTLAADAKRVFSIYELINVSEQLEILQALRLEPSILSPLSFQAALGENKKNKEIRAEPVPILYFTLIPFEDWALVSCAIIDVRAKIDNEIVEWTGSVPNFQTVRVIIKQEAEVDRFIERMQYQNNIKGYFVNKDDLFPIST